MTLIIYLSKDRKVKKIIKPTGKFMSGEPTFGDYQRLAMDLCSDAREQYFGFDLI